MININFDVSTQCKGTPNSPNHSGAIFLKHYNSIPLFSDIAGLLGGALYTGVEIGLSFSAYVDRTIAVLMVGDIMQGLFKSLIFALIITLVGASNGFSVTGGAEGVGKATTRSVVLSISFIVIADMIFTYFLNR